ncbi:hypothetical protein HBI56_024560 [Parastagonospora nodorum]|uniref:Uncharacterized protein n=1 Tax=Phaeosphaeria nodorum (strain SN15 / ATCC MYA-4574 / FGSC 10173) TaxID=321614 RepID=A0A7U2F4V6_PHANO|nr:hypothetical protein HBH56_023980 [Parastagonospora nodorum]QRC98756.1 hypothetical protein JI435_412500 [Parastagonospora nodorum SN15]KAH3934539.1 hypothetical protein HBH54_058050 [Parastagonospora nodorum]KAH3949637.1 hypothetical protein HBH53_085750 [Parastagonospora nodorum]KAH3975975.1 hypothetical protein HBH51_079640 [Parastagonospora nodorum]
MHQHQQLYIHHDSRFVGLPIDINAIGPSSTASLGFIIVYRQSRARRDTQGSSTATPPFVPAIQAKAHHSQHATEGLYF